MSDPVVKAVTSSHEKARRQKKQRKLRMIVFW